MKTLSSTIMVWLKVRCIRLDTYDYRRVIAYERVRHPK